MVAARVMTTPGEGGRTDSVRYSAEHRVEAGSGVGGPRRGCWATPASRGFRSGSVPGFGVEPVDRLVEDERPGVAQEGGGDAQALAQCRGRTFRRAWSLPRPGRSSR